MQEQCSKTDAVRVHRVGTFTSGLMLVVSGILFILHQFLPVISYKLIFHLWPCILILIGTELLISGHFEKQKFVPDAVSVILLVILMGFAVCMAGVDVVISRGCF